MAPNWLAWLYWDPPREAFTLPFLDRPVVWYGVLFVAGFMLGYFILNPPLSRFLKQSRHLSSLDILDWHALVNTLRTSSSPLVSQLFLHFDTAISTQLKHEAPPLLTLALQQGILEGLNRCLQHSSLSRDDLQLLFGNTLALPKQTAYLLTDRLCWFVVAGTVIGARLGEVFFYDWPYFRAHPFEIFQIWRGGLASHGGVLGVVIAVFLYLRYIHHWMPQLSFLRLLDYIAIPSALVACFIRLGNFMNQEILGTPTTLPWGVIFGHPADGSFPLARHPVQLYEAGAYLLTFMILWSLWKKQTFEERPGGLGGLLFIFIFGSRFILEFWKTTQTSLLETPILQVGQLLSIPFILFGAFLLWKSRPSYCS
jgi:phosphatidylglycerol:prolipoprotein diacylglycerol transferase